MVKILSYKLFPTLHTQLQGPTYSATDLPRSSHTQLHEPSPSPKYEIDKFKLNSCTSYLAFLWLFYDFLLYSSFITIPWSANQGRVSKQLDSNKLRVSDIPKAPSTPIDMCYSRSAPQNAETLQYLYNLNKNLKKYDPGDPIPIDLKIYLFYLLLY